MLHLGHAFSLSKTEFSMGFERLQGKKTLWPFGFHCTGMPIQAAADNLRREMIKLREEVNLAAANGTEGSTDIETKARDEAEVEGSMPDLTKHVGKKTKAASKKGKGSQWQILESMGIDREIVPEFVDPHFWLQYFPPLAKDDLREMGAKIDWRRSFITTSVNPYYDAFIQWQFLKLKELHKVRALLRCLLCLRHDPFAMRQYASDAVVQINFGKRYSVYSPCDRQICADHDRATGEGVGPQEYVLIKLEVLDLPDALKHFAEKKVVLLAATLRPETMYGQTNCWVLPHEKDGSEAWYGCYETVTPGEVAVVAERAAVNMAHQGLLPEFAKAIPVCKVRGRDLVGLPLKAPLTSLPRIYSLPMLTISMKKGTGIVTSVPSDAPDDYIALMDLKRKPALREKYGVKDDWVLPIEIIPIITVPYKRDDSPEDQDPEMTDLAAQVACDEFKVSSQNDKPQLLLAKAKTYKLGFYEGTLKIGDCKGMSVQDAKAHVKKQMVETGVAYAYAEPEKEVMSRSGNECVVALTDQWYIKYGEDSWRKKVEEYLKSGSIAFYNDDTRTRFENALDWLGEWGCSRSFGLGTLLPWDKQFVIESLSDSTIYMAYYTFAHILQAGPLDGSVPGEGNIAATELTEEVFDYIMLDKPYPNDSKIPREVLDRMKNEFQYWYPVDLRVSGKDLIQNHLTFFLYIHCAVFSQKHWPKSIRTNGHLLLNGEKMSKSVGNFKTLRAAIQEYSADAMRLALALSGDSNEDANFEHDVANAAILKLTNEIQFVEKAIVDVSMREGPVSLFIDSVFANEINRLTHSAEACFKRMNYRDAVIEGWDKLQNARDKYRAMAATIGMRKDLVMKFIDVQTLLISPFCPHYAEHVWELTGHATSVMSARWPTADNVDAMLVRMNGYFEKTLSDLRSKAEKARVKVKLFGAVIYVADEFLDWQQTTLNVLRHVATSEGSFKKDFKKRIMALPDMSLLKPLTKVVMPFVAFCMDDFDQRGVEAFELKMPFDEVQVLTDLLDYIKRELALDTISIQKWPPVDVAVAKKLQPPTPGKPAVVWSSPS